MKITKNFLNSFIKNVIDKPEGFIMPNEARSAQALKATKELYDLGRYTIIIFEVVGFLPLTSFFSSWSCYFSYVNNGEFQQFQSSGSSNRPTKSSNLKIKKTYY